MSKKHIALVKKGSKNYQATNRTLTYLGRYKGEGLLYGDLGLPQNWKAYQKERTKLGLPAAKD